MFKIICIFFLLFATFCQLDQVLSLKWVCNDKSETQIDEMIAQMLVFGTERKFPENKDEAKTFCSETMAMFKKVEAYKDQCLQERPKQILGVLAYAVKSTMNKLCKNLNGKRATEIIKSANCPNANLLEIKKCADYFMNTLEEIKKIKESKERLAQLCCGYNQVFTCLRTKGKAIKTCTEKKLETLFDFIKGVTDNAVNLLCTDYDSSSDNCDKLKLIVPKRGYKGIPGKSGKVSLAKPLVHVLTNL